MSGGIFSIEADAFDSLLEKMESYGPGAADTVTEALYESGPDIYERINALIHPSGRTFKGHKSSAVSSAWPRYDKNKKLEITVGTKGKYHYLYFPDDGSNTRRHAGMQEFFKRGAEAASDKVVQRCEEALIKEWES